MTVTKRVGFGVEGNVSMCIYTITNKLTGKVYVGQTKGTAKKRWASHCCPSNASNSYISKAINMHGRGSFDFSVIDIAESIESLGHKEIFWIDHFKCMAPTGYNLKAGGSFDSFKSEAVRKSWSDAQSKFWGNEKRSRGYYRSLMTPYQKEQTMLRAIEKMSNTKKGKPTWLSINGLSLEAKAKMVASKTGVEVPNKWKPVTRSDGEEFESIKAAALATKVNRTGICAVLAGRAKTVGGYSFRYKEET